MTLKAVQLTGDGRLLILDQTLLPGRVEYLELTDKQSLIEAIRALRVRGAPAIGIAAAYGLYVLARSAPELDCGRLRRQLLADSAEIKAARPTAVNLAWALERMEKALQDAGPGNREILLKALQEEAAAIDREDAGISRAIARHGLPLIAEGCGVLTHCNAGGLATSELGTALAPLYLAHQLGRRFTVYCDETRPLLQGARLTAFELLHAGIDTVLICDNTAASLMAAGKISLVLVGADRIAANGDIANKIGTLSLAVNARYFGIPFYAAAPGSTIDPDTASGRDIVIEQRPGTEITTLWYERPMAPAGVKTLNPAFDVTPAALISGIIDERGLHLPPYNFRPTHNNLV